MSVIFVNFGKISLTMNASRFHFLPALFAAVIASVLALAGSSYASAQSRSAHPADPDNPVRYSNGDGERILRQGYQLMDHPKDRRFLLYRDPNGLYGFVINCSDPVVIIKPVFEDAYVNYTLIAVKYKGKWGAIDVSFDRVPGKDPIIPFVYDRIDVIDDNCAYLWKDGKKTFVDIRDIRKRLEE